jgi:hypothetical protein
VSTPTLFKRRVVYSTKVQHKMQQHRKDAASTSSKSHPTDCICTESAGVLFTQRRIRLYTAQFHQQMATKARALQTTVPPFDEVFQQSEYCEVNQQQLRNHKKFFDCDPNVQTGFNFRLGALLNGGIVVKRKGKIMTGAAKEWTTKEFTRFLREVVCNFWYAGYAAAVWEEHPQFGGVPRLLDLTQVRTLYRRDIYGTPIARYVYQAPGELQECEITNVLTMWHTPPDKDGCVTSMISLLAQDSMTETLMHYYAMIAMKGRALPVLITEKDREVYDADNISAPAALTPEQIRSGQTTATSNELQEVSGKVMQVMNATEALYNEMQPAMTGAFTATIAATMKMPHYSTVYQLAQGRKHAAAQMPEGPTDLMAFRIARQERAFSLMGVPLAMVTNATSTGSGKMAQGENSNSFVLFENAQASLKQELISVATQMFYSIHLKAHMEEYLNSTPPDKYNMQDLAESTEVQIMLPSLPDENKLVEWFKAGWYKYDSLIEALATKHCIPIDAFENKPALSVAELAGEFADPAPPPAKKAKK